MGTWVKDQHSPAHHCMWQHPRATLMSSSSLWSMRTWTSLCLIGAPYTFVFTVTCRFVLLADGLVLELLFLLLWWLRIVYFICACWGHTWYCALHQLPTDCSFGHTPLQDAVHNVHDDICDYLRPKMSKKSAAFPDRCVILAILYCILWSKRFQKQVAA